MKNVAWLENFLTSLTDVTCMLVSHDSGFLDRVCTDIIHYENRKLKRYRGNLSEFVKQKPEARSYYELSAATIKFTFPEPGYLEGVKTKDKGILKMTRVAFKYPNTDRIILAGVSIYCSLSTRVAIHGANGAPPAGLSFQHPSHALTHRRGQEHDDQAADGRAGADRGHRVEAP